MTDQIPNAEASFMQSMALMNKVVSQMKEIPELPSEKPKDVHALKRVEFPEAGGVLTYMEGYDHPYRGFPFHEFVDRIDVIKKIARAILSGLFHGLKGNKLKLLTFIPCAWAARIAVSVGIYAFSRMVERFRIKRQIYSQPIRELYRAFSMERYGEDEKTRILRLQLRDLVCMILEFDNAYRYRLQDIVVELNQAALRANAIKELGRLLSVMQGRERGQDIVDTWTLLKLFIQVYLRIDRKFTRMIVDVLSQLKLDEMKLSVEDQFYCKPRKDYNFGFITTEQEYANRGIRPIEKQEALFAL